MRRPVCDSRAPTSAISAARSSDSLVTGLPEGAYTSFWSDPPTRARHVERILTVYRSMLAPQPAAHTLPREAAE
jgi:hypothetical protein